MSHHHAAATNVAPLTIDVIATKPFAGQKPGTSGLRKKVKEVSQPHYCENFIHCVFDALPPTAANESRELVIAGDGRYYNEHVITTIVRMSQAHHITSIVLCTHHLMPTPAISALVRARKAMGAFILTASHNPGGVHEDFGLKYNTSNGGPAPESLTDAIYQKTLTISSYSIARETPHIDVTKVHSVPFGDQCTIHVVDGPSFYSQFLSTLFDFTLLKTFVARPDFSLIHDSMHGVAGPFARNLFVTHLGLSEHCLMKADPLPDFGGGHPDPNLTYAAELVQRMGLPSEHAHSSHGTSAVAATTAHHKIPDFGAANDGDADRNMILGAKFFVTPSDSVAVIAANSKYIPYFSKQGGLKGVARSMPTSAALDRVAEALKITCYEVPTGWKFFGNLMDAGKLSICGEESFGTGGDHCREKDGLWAVLAWLSILAGRNSEVAAGQPLISVKDIVQDHWKLYGRNYYSRYDYEQVESAAADSLMKHLLSQVSEFTSAASKPTWENYTLQTADEFTYTDPVDHSVSEHQGIRFSFTDGSRIVFRLSGTGSVGATIRLYVERYDRQELHLETAAAVAPLIQIALTLCKMKELTGRDKPTVIT